MTKPTEKIARSYNVGAAVVYVDPYGKAGPAKAKVWHGREGLPDDAPNPSVLGGEPTINLATDEDPDHVVGSVTHKSKSSAPGRFWHWPDEAPGAEPPGLMDGTPKPSGTSNPPP